MSGGHFDYDQYRMNLVVAEIEDIISNNDSTDKDSYGDEIGRHYSHETIEKFKQAVEVIERAVIMTNRIDWLVSGDDSEASFHKRWENELAEMSLRRRKQ